MAHTTCDQGAIKMTRLVSGVEGKWREGMAEAPVHVHIMAAEVERDEKLKDQREIRIGGGQKTEQTRCRASILDSDVSYIQVRNGHRIACP